MALSVNIRAINKFYLNNVNNCIAGVRKNFGEENHPSQLRNRSFTVAACKEEEKVCKCKVALITGGGRGIGYHIAEKILSEGAQAVILGDIVDEECQIATCQLNEKYGAQKALYQPCDVRNKDDMEKIFKCIIQRFGKIDIVVNNAGILADNRWEDTIAINIKGLVHGTLLGFQYMSEKNCRNGGIILNNASILGLQPFYPSPVYTGTKHFIIGFSRSMGHDYFFKQTKVKVMAFCPGVTDTKMVSDAGDAQLQTFGDLGKEAKEQLGCLPPQGPEIVGKCIIEMIKAGENGSVWVSEGCDNYKVSIPDRQSFKPKCLKGCPPKCDEAQDKKSATSNAKDEKKAHKHKSVHKDANNKKAKTKDEKPKGKLIYPIKDSNKSKDPGKPKADSSKPKEDPCKPKEDPCKPKEDPCKKKEDPCKPKEDPCKPKEDPCKPKEDPCKKKEDPCKPKDDPCKPKEDPCKPKEDPCKPKEDPCKPKK